MRRFLIGDRVRVNFYGVERVGTVVSRDERNGPIFRESGMYWITFDGETQKRWFHVDSLRPV